MEQTLAFLYGTLFESQLNVFFLTFWGIIFTEYLRRFLVASSSVVPVLFQKKGELIKTRMREEGRRVSIQGVSILVPAHNCADTLNLTIQSLNQQTVEKKEIIVVNDGSSDETDLLCREMLRTKQIQNYIHIQSRGGKAAALNTAASVAKNAFLIICDAGTTLHSDAIEVGLAYFTDPKVAAVAGNVGVLNLNKSLLTKIQMVDYTFSAFLARNVFRMMNFAFVVPGALGFYRKEVFNKVGGYLPGTGEDLELATVLRYLGWKLEFSIYSMSLTDVPEHLGPLIKQRLRWNKDTARILLKKYSKLAMNPLTNRFDLWLTVGLFELFFTDLFFSVLVYGYVVYFYYLYGVGFSFILLGGFFLYLFLSLIYLFMGILINSSVDRNWKLLLYCPLYILFKELFLRPIRLYIIFAELIFNVSSKDPFVPKKVQRALSHREEQGPK